MRCAKDASVSRRSLARSPLRPRRASLSPTNRENFGSDLPPLRITPASGVPAALASPAAQFPSARSDVFLQTVFAQQSIHSQATRSQFGRR